MRLARKLFGFFAALALVSAFGCGKERKEAQMSMRQAEILMSTYMSALKSGDPDTIKEYWSRASLNRKGFDVMHLWVRGLIHISEWKSFLDSTKYTFQIKELHGEDGYCVLNGEWRKPDGDFTQDQSHPMPFYLVWEDGRWLLVNPIDILTRNWRRFEATSIVFFCPKDITIEDHMQEIRLLDEQCESMCRAMGYTPDRKIEYYKASSPDECGRLLTQGAFNGLAAATYKDSIPWFQIAVSTSFYNPHEVMHIIALSSGVPMGNLLFSEGIAVAYGGTTFQSAAFAHIYSRIVLDDSTYIPVRQLLAMSGNDFLRSNYITYQESGSFVRYLIDTYGIDRLKNFVSGFRTSADPDAQAMRVYDISFDELETNWHGYLKQMEMLSPGFSVPHDARLVFGMTDPANDDDGDGDYRYPSDGRYVRGCFDLTKFEVLKDDDSVYFRIALQQLITPFADRPGGVRFMPMVVIAINNGDEHKAQRFRYTNEIALADGYDLKINVGFGINISNDVGKIYLSTGDCYGAMADPGSNSLAFSLPIELVGEPQDKWKYFVGVGLGSEATFNFSGLAPVLRSVPSLISGGNFDYSNPAFIDILLPEGVNQSAVLSDYDAPKGKLATLRMVSITGEGF